MFVYTVVRTAALCLHLRIFFADFYSTTVFIARLRYLFHVDFFSMSRRGLDPINLAYNPCWPDVRLKLTASAFNRLQPVCSSPGHRACCYAELAVSSQRRTKPSPVLIALGMARLSGPEWPG